MKLNKLFVRVFWESMILSRYNRVLVQCHVRPIILCTYQMHQLNVYEDVQLLFA